MSKTHITDQAVFYFRKLKNGTPEIVLDCQESMLCDWNDLSKLEKKFVSFHIVEGEEIANETGKLLEGLPGLKTTKGEKSKSQILRGVLYRLWEQQYQGDYEKSDGFYDHIMTQIINHYKTKLNDF